MLVDILLKNGYLIEVAFIEKIQDDGRLNIIFCPSSGPSRKTVITVDKIAQIIDIDGNEYKNWEEITTFLVNYDSENNNHPQSSF